MSRRVPILGIAGPSGGGKSALARYLSASLAHRRPALLSLDSYYHDLAHLAPTDRARVNFDQPQALDWDLLLGHLTALAQGRAVAQPRYDFTRHTRAEGGRPTGPGGLVVVEGLFALAPRLRPLLDLGVWVEAPEEVCLQRRLARDTTLRGRSPASVREQYRHTVRPMYLRHVLPTREEADLRLSGQARLEESARVIAERLAGLAPGEAGP